MKKLVMVVAVVVAVALAIPVLAQEAAKDKVPQDAKDKKVDVTGVWEISVESPQGQMAITATYKQEGETLTGKHVSEMGEVPLKGTVKGADINYTITMDFGGQAVTITHTGKVDGDTMAGTADLGDMGKINWTAKRKKS